MTEPKGLCANCGFPCSVVDDTERLEADLGAMAEENTRLRGESRYLRAELELERKARREPGCQCTSEIGDSPCPVHPLDPETELPYTPAKASALAAEVLELREQRVTLQTAVKAFGATIAELEATLARVKARAEEWAASSRKWNGLGCANDALDALGEP